MTQAGRNKDRLCIKFFMCVIVISAMDTFYFCPKLQDKHCREYYDYDRENLIYTKSLLKPCEIQSGSYILYFPQKKSDKNFKPNMKQFPPLNMFFFFISVCVCWVWVLSGEPLSTDEALTKRKSKQFPVNFSLVFISPQYEFYRIFSPKIAWWKLRFDYR